jgi:phage repressor protein C with HTH and peptisase S24 domain
MNETAHRVDKELNDIGRKWADLARHIGVSDQVVQNWKARGIPKNALPKVADFLGRTIDWVMTGNNAGHAVSEQRTPYHRITTPPADELEFVGRMDVWDSNTPLDDDEVELPLFREVELAAGAGQTQVIENHGAKLRFAKSTLSRAGVQKEHAACAFVKGNSMEPVMPDGTCIGVNTGDTTVRDGEIYAIDHDGMLRVKYLHRRPGGGIKIVSQNAIEHEPEDYPAQKMADENIRIIGRVFWWSVLR